MNSNDETLIRAMISQSGKTLNEESLLGRKGNMKDKDNITKIRDRDRAYIDVDVSDSETRRYLLAHQKRVITCWLCGGSSERTCRCHNHGVGSRPLHCDMVCN